MIKFVRSVNTAALAAVAAVLALSSPATSARADMLAPIWTGAYVGFHGGGTWGSINFKDITNSDTSAWTGGGHAGFNLGFGALVAGVEGDLTYDGSDGGYTFTGGGGGNLDTNWNATLRGRIGMPVGPALLYATAGFAWKDATYVEANGAGLSASANHTFTGVVYGVGAETYVMPNLSLRLEALRYDYGTETVTFGGAAAAVQEIDPSDTVVRAGVTFHLN